MVAVKRPLTLLLFLVYCEAKPIKILNDDSNTTPCPDEMRITTGQLQTANPLKASETSMKTDSDTLQEITTLCPEELEKIRQDTSMNTNEKVSSKNEVSSFDGIAEESNDSTTECPDKLEKQRFETREQETTITPKETEQNQEEQRNEVDGPNETHSPETETTICPEELAKKHNEQKQLEVSVVDLNKSKEPELIGLPEKLTNGKAEKNKSPIESVAINIKDAFKEDDATKLNGDWVSDFSTTPCPEEMAKKQEQNFEENLLSFTEQLPEEQKLYQFSQTEAEQSNELSVKTLLSVQKDSALLKLVKGQISSNNNQNSETDQSGGIVQRSKRQTPSDYSQYYANQPSYDSQGQATDFEGSAQKFNSKPPQSSSYQAVSQSQPSYNSRPTGQSSNPRKNPTSYSNIRTYQQIQRQYQNFVPKSYQNNVQPVTSYQNPSLYVRHPSNGSFKNYYKLKSGGNRRQYQAKSRASSTTFRSTTRAFKKKFRPSPVFA